jgi:hypothetical protein
MIALETTAAIPPMLNLLRNFVMCSLRDQKEPST